MSASSTLEGRVPDKPLYSVLVAAFNQADFIVDALDSVANQTCEDWELVVVDDGSIDNTGEVLEKWLGVTQSTREQRIVVVTQSNCGQSVALEAGFAHCRGRYIALLDSDDIWLPEKLERVLAETTRDPAAGMIVHPLWVIGPDGQRTGDMRPREAALSAGDLRAQIRRTARHVAPPTSGVVLKAEVFSGLLPMPTRAYKSAADAYLTLGASLLATVRVITDPLAEYRLHPAGHYLQRMQTAQGLAMQVEIQSTIAGHFGLDDVVHRNSFFARNRYGWARLAGSRRVQIEAWTGLLRAVWNDPAFSATQRAKLLLFWAATMILPRPLFRRAWTYFQLKQTGYSRLDPALVQALVRHGSAR